ncbi:prepilin peptidase [Paenibacillus sonchi]|uniref:prepilin peptidase n=1 Tax=Paenibacillus sonchi TaxID=373687 RepID=UPI001E462941|nr:prepilin peptidase [Paenibacillus sonchi]MCE3203459.1 prepilin peptidase [Paenibacillus sonchi]
MERWLIDLPLILILVCATYTDMRERVIPNRLVLVGLGYMLLARLFIADQFYGYYVLGVVVASGLMYLIALFIPGSIGGGDIKLLAVVGAAIGWRESLIFLWLLLAVAGVFAVVGMLIWRNRKLRIPMAPFFLMASIMLWRIDEIQQLLPSG